MYGAYRSVETWKFKLDQDDIDGIQDLYGEPTGRTLKMPDVLKPPELPVITEAPRVTYQYTDPVYETEPPTRPPIAEVCTLDKYQAAGFYRGDFWIFSDDKIFRRDIEGWAVFEDFGANGKALNWEHLPQNPVFDDFFESRDPRNANTNGMLYLIAHTKTNSQQRMWKYSGTEIQRGWEKGKSLVSLGLPRSVLGRKTKIIGSTYWKRNNVAYMFDDNEKYYRYNVSMDRFDRSHRMDGEIKRKYPADFEDVWSPNGKIRPDFDTVFNGVSGSSFASEIAKKFISDAKNVNDKNPEHLTFFVNGLYSAFKKFGPAPKFGHFS